MQSIINKHEWSDYEKLEQNWCIIKYKIINNDYHISSNKLSGIYSDCEILPVICDTGTEKLFSIYCSFLYLYNI